MRVMTRGGTSWCVMVVVEGDGGDGDCTHIGYKEGQIMIHEPPGPSHFSSKRQYEAISFETGQQTVDLVHPTKARFSASRSPCWQRCHRLC